MKRNNSEAHLHSTHEMTGYQIKGTDGLIGNIKDFVMDDHSWQLAYMVVDTNDTLHNKRLLIEVRNIKNIDRNNLMILVDVSHETIRNCPVFNKPKIVHVEIIHDDCDNYALVPE